MKIIAVNAYEDNYIWVITPDEQQQNCPIIAVDPGDADPLLTAMQSNHWDLKAILITHHHRDHVGGIACLTENREIPVYGSVGSGHDWITHSLQEGDELSFPDLQCDLRVMETPGHTSEDLSYYGGGALFCGDTLFSAGCGRIFSGTYAQMYHSLKRLGSLDEQTLIYCAHEYTLDNLKFAAIAEPENITIKERIKEVSHLRKHNRPSVPTLLKVEKESNPFLRSHYPPLQQKAENYCGRELHTPAEVFTAVRHWKDDLD